MNCLSTVALFGTADLQPFSLEGYRIGRQRIRWLDSIPGLNTTSLCCTLLTYWRPCCSLNFSTLPTVTFKAYALSCCYLFPSSSPILFVAIVSPSCFLQFLILSESLSLLLLTLLASYLQGWRLIKKPPPARDTFQRVVFGTQNHRCHMAGPGHLPPHGVEVTR